MVGAVKGTDPDTGEYYDDTKRYIDRAPITDDQRLDIFERNVQRVYPRLQVTLDD
jgi:4-oxalmesaconate hydratase